MSMSDPIADMLTRIRNGMRVRKKAVLVPASKIHKSILDVLKREGYIRHYEEQEVRTNIKILSVELKYHDGIPVIKTIDRVSKPGCRQYSRIEDLKSFHNGLGISILSTASGVLSDKEAREKNVGGEVICQVF